MDPTNSDENRPVPGRRPRVSILEMMGVVAALGIAFRWPGLSIPVALLFFYLLARRRGLLAPATLSSLWQITLALYLPPAAGLLLIPFAGWDEYLGIVSAAPAFLPGALIGGFDWAREALILPEGTGVRIILSVASLSIIGGLVRIGRLGLGWRVACVVAALGLSGVSMFGLLLAAMADA